MKLLSSLFLALCLMTGSVSAQTVFAPTQCSMLGDIVGDMVVREIRGEKPEAYLVELFPKFNQYPEEAQELIITLVKVIKKDRVVFPETADVPQAHADAVAEFCFAAQGDISVMMKGFESFLK